MAHIKSVNKTILIGRLGSDPEIRYTKSGTAVCTLSIATSKSFKKKDSDDWYEVTQWHRVVLWRGLAEFAAERLSKGAAIYVEGELRYRTWEDNDGNSRKTAEIYATTCNLLADGRSTSADSTETPEDDEVPF